MGLMGETKELGNAVQFCQIRPCYYEATVHIPLSSVLQLGTLCAEDVPIGVLKDHRCQISD